MQILGAVAPKIPKLGTLVDIIKAGQEDDRAGVDYYLIPQKGRWVAVDLKERAHGASRWWYDGEPELAIERHSIMEGDVAGPLYRNNVSTDVYVFTFADLPHVAYAVDAAKLREAARRGDFDRYPLRYQLTDGGDRGDYHSACRFVPVLDVSAATGRMWAVELDHKISQIGNK